LRGQCRNFTGLPLHRLSVFIALLMSSKKPFEKLKKPIEKRALLIVNWFAEIFWKNNLQSTIYN
jgi:hypothetical protein